MELETRESEQTPAPTTTETPDQKSAPAVRPIETPVPTNQAPSHDQFGDVRDLPEGIKVPGTDTEIVVDDEFRKLLRRLRKDELKELEKNLVEAGRARDKLIVWKQEGILLDGHHRLLLCLKHKLPFEVEAIDLPDDAAAMQWMRKHQLGKRNLTPDEQAYQRGKLYNQSKQKKGGDRKSAKKATGATGKEVAAELAKKDGVSPATVLRDGKFSDAVDRLVLYHGEGVRALLIGEDAKLNREEVSDLAALDPRKQKEVISEIQLTGRWNRSPAPKEKSGSPKTRQDKAASSAATSDQGKEMTAPTSSDIDGKKVKRIALDHGMQPYQIAERLFGFFETEVIVKIGQHLRSMLPSKKGSPPFPGFRE